MKSEPESPASPTAESATDRGWITVESTPTEGVPAPAEISKPSQFLDAASAAMLRFRTLPREGGAAWLAAAGLRLLASRTGAALLTLLAAIVTLRMWRRRKSQPRPAPENAEPAALHRLLARMDARLQKMHLERRAGETLHQFAARIGGRGGAGSGETGPALKEAAAWYERYAMLRYSATAVRLASEELSQALPRVRE